MQVCLCWQLCSAPRHNPSWLARSPRGCPLHKPVDEHVGRFSWQQSESLVQEVEDTWPGRPGRHRSRSIEQGLRSGSWSPCIARRTRTLSAAARVREESLGQSAVAINGASPVSECAPQWCGLLHPSAEQILDRGPPPNGPYRPRTALVRRGKNPLNSPLSTSLWVARAAVRRWDAHPAGCSALCSSPRSPTRRTCDPVKASRGFPLTSNILPRILERDYSERG